MNEEAKKFIIEKYQDSFLRYGSSPEGVQMSLEGQRFRFEKLAQIADLNNCRILDLGCGIGDMYPFMMDRFGYVNYTGIDIVPELVSFASERYPDARFLCCNILNQNFDEMFDYVLISSVVQTCEGIPDSTEYLKELITAAFRHCSLGIGFNFISEFVNFTNPEMAYHDPVEIFDYCLKEFSPKVMVHHHYERCDVAIFVYR
jgi:SAM-dependent methyltransferase